MSGAPVTKKGLPLWVRCSSSGHAQETGPLKQKKLYISQRWIICIQSIWYSKAHKSKKTKIEHHHDRLGGPLLSNKTCALTTEAGTNYGLRHRLPPNKRYLKIHINTRNPEKITKGSKWPWDYERQGAKSYCVHQHSHKLHSTVLKQKGWHRFQELVISM
jgi:hypothetical protein